MKAKTSANTDKDATGKPSLYSFNSRDRDTGEIFSILDALEPRRHKSAVWWRMALIGLVAVLAGALYMVGRHVDVYRHLSPAADSGEIARAPGAAGPGKAEPPAAAADSSPAAPTAAIVVEAPLHHAELLAAEPADKGESATEHNAPMAMASITNAAAAESADPASEHDATAVPLKDKGIGNTPEKKKAPATVRKQESRPPHVTVNASAAPRAGKDSDIDLIAALVAHVSHADAGGKEARKNEARTPPVARTSAGVARKERRIDTSRDIVTRREEDSTAALVARCRSLGLIEGELCRLRICSGLWGTDPACPGAPSGDAQLTSGR